MFFSEAITHALLVIVAAGLIIILVLYRKNKRLKTELQQLIQQTNTLTEEKVKLIEQLRSTVQPDFVVTGISLNDSLKRIDIKVQNRGHAALLDKVVTSTPDIEFLDDRFYPQQIELNEYFIFTGLSKELPLAQCRYVVQLHYTDAHGNKYMTAIRGEGQEYQLNTSIKDNEVQ